MRNLPVCRAAFRPRFAERPMRRSLLCLLCCLALASTSAKADNLDVLATYFETTIGDITSNSTLTKLVTDDNELAGTVDFGGLVDAAILSQLRILDGRFADFQGGAGGQKSMVDLIEAVNSGWGHNPESDEPYNLGDVVAAIEDNQSQGTSTVSTAVIGTQGISPDTGEKFTYAHIIAAQAATRIRDLTAADYVNADVTQETYEIPKVYTSGYKSEATPGETTEAADSIKSIKNSPNAESVTDTLTATFTAPTSKSNFTSHQDWSCISLPTSLLPYLNISNKSFCVGTSKYNSTIISFVKILVILGAFFVGVRIVFA